MNSPSDSFTSLINPLPQGWKQISPAPGNLRMVGDILYARDNFTQTVLRYDQFQWNDQLEMYWRQVGDACDQIASSLSTLYSLTDRAGTGTVHQFDDSLNTWTPIGMGFGNLIGGGQTIYGTVQNGDIYRYTGKVNVWNRLGGAGYQFVANAANLYGITIDQQEVAYFRSVDNWPAIGQNAEWAQLIAGGDQLYAVKVDSDGDNIYQYLGTPNQWKMIGGPGFQFAAYGKRFIGIGPDKNYVAQYIPSTGQWPSFWRPSNGEIMDTIALGNRLAFGVCSLPGISITLLYTFQESES